MLLEYTMICTGGESCLTARATWVRRLAGSRRGSARRVGSGRPGAATGRVAGLHVPVNRGSAVIPDRIARAYLGSVVADEHGTHHAAGGVPVHG